MLVRIVLTVEVRIEIRMSMLRRMLLLLRSRIDISNVLILHLHRRSQHVAVRHAIITVVNGILIITIVNRSTDEHGLVARMMRL